LEWLIANGIPEAQTYAAQLDHLRVVGRCGCGCPTVDLAFGDSQHNTTGPSHILADCVGVTPEGIEVGIMLHAREDKISELEIYSLAGCEHPFGLPRIETLKQF